MKSRGSEGMGKEGGQEQSSAECVAWQKGVSAICLLLKRQLPPKASDSMFLCFCVRAPVWFCTNYYFGTWGKKEEARCGNRSVYKVRIDPFCFFPSQGLCSLPCCCLQCFSFNTNYSHGVSFSYYALHWWLFIFSANLSTGQQMSLLFRCHSFFFLFFTYKRLTFKWSFHQATAQTYMKGLAKGYTIYRLSTGFYTVHIRGLMSSKVNDL